MPTKKILRRATQGDVNGIVTLVDDAYGPYIARMGRKPGPMLDDYRHVVEQTEAFVVTEDEAIVGLLVMRKEEDDELLLINVAVLPRRKGQGIGKMLMTFCEQHALELGCPAVRLYTHQLMVENIEIYKKLGYRETHRATNDGFARVFMRKVVG